MAIRMTASEISDKHAKRTIAAIPEFTAGVAGVTESPTAKAAASQDKWLAGIQKAAEMGRFKSGLERVSLDEWKRKTLNKGAGRIAAGVEESKGKVTDFFEDFLPHLEVLDRKLKDMPSVTLEDSIARATAAIRHNAEFRRS